MTPALIAGYLVKLMPLVWLRWLVVGVVLYAAAMMLGSKGGQVPDRKGNPPDLDELYGLEPVIEPGNDDAPQDGSASLQLRTVQCPYCGEPFETLVDFSSGATSYIEDCAICCRPIEFRLEVAAAGTGASLQVGRSD